MTGKKSGGRPAGTTYRNATYAEEQRLALDMLRAGHSHRAIAKQLGLARDTVARIAKRGKVDVAAIYAQQRMNRQYIPTRRIAWCRACGANVVQPCLKCWLLARKGGGE